MSHYQNLKLIFKGTHNLGFLVCVQYIIAPEYVKASTGGGGWPLSIFLAPDLKPVYGGNAF